MSALVTSTVPVASDDLSAALLFVTLLVVIFEKVLATAMVADGMTKFSEALDVAIAPLMLGAVGILGSRLIAAMSL
jgi:hypothetical protein